MPKSETAAEPAARFYLDHGMVHDRETGKHVTTDEDSVFCDGREAACALLNSLSSAAVRRGVVLAAILAADERGQGLPFAEAMDAAKRECQV